jgi:hypothetical protein
VSASTVHRPTENAAIGRVQPPRIQDTMWLVGLRDKARARLDLALERLINGAIARSVNPLGGER